VEGPHGRWTGPHAVAEQSRRRSRSWRMAAL
jgi:hypothetical protein